MQTVLPVWTDDNNIVRYDLPQELQGLRDGEKLLISPYLVYVPLYHLRKGQLASQGHVCCFPQDVASLCVTLPRLPQDTHLIKVIRQYNYDDRESQGTKIFSIRRYKIEKALTWLKKYSVAFDGIEIDFRNNLNWMDGQDEKELDPYPSIQQEMSEDEFLYGENSDDKGPAPSQTNAMLNVPGTVVEHTCGGLSSTTSDRISIPSTQVCEQIGAAVSAAQRMAKAKSAEIIWPHVGTNAVSEYADPCLFPRAFPWLFPGGVGDFRQQHDVSIDINDWISLLLRYEDGRFAADKMFCFYALNYRERLRNQNRGSFFVKRFAGEEAKSVQDIIQDIRNGNMSWIEKITYFNGFVKGSSTYWRNKRDEVHSWIRHHVRLGHGPPTFFITLSCAEYWWKDIERLIVDRFVTAGQQPPDFSAASSKVTFINNYTVVVQEYFQQRVKEWLTSVGAKIFKIKYYWCRFEFAPSRGQVHAHLLAISPDFLPFFKKLHHKVPHDSKAQELTTWAQDNLGLTNEAPGSQVLPANGEDEFHPCSLLITEIDDMARDLYSIMGKCQFHVCSDYCLRKRSVFRKNEDSKSRKRRVCKFGCKVEKNPNQGDTPGFTPRSASVLVRDCRGNIRLELARSSTNKRIISTASFALQSWRANCDVQLLNYNSDPTDIDPADLATVCDYVVSYSCKGTESVHGELTRLKALTLSLDEQSTEECQVTFARKLMNTAIKQKMISKQEAMVLTVGLDLCITTDQFTTISLSGSYRLGNTATYTNKFYNEYAHRVACFRHMSMDDYFYHTNMFTNVVPHYVGAKMQPVWPPTFEFARSMLIVFTPWHRRFDIHSNDVMDTFFTITNSATCPATLRQIIDRAILRFKEKSDFKDMANPKVNYDDFTMEDDNDDTNDDLVALVSTLPRDAIDPYTDFDYNYGLNYDWHLPSVSIPSSIPLTEVQTWVDDHIFCPSRDNYVNSANNQVQYPTKPDGSPFLLQEAKQDQAQVLAYILNIINQWFDRATNAGDTRDLPPPIRLTVAGGGGSGKSTLINTLATCIRRIFNSTRSVVISAPTGSAAHNVNGATCHYVAGIGKLKKEGDSSLSKKVLADLKQKLWGIVCFIIDERSLLSSSLLSTIEDHFQQAANNGLNMGMDWGNIPIVILFGDDYQLPSIHSGALNIFNDRGFQKDIPTLRGDKLFLNFAQTYMELDSSKRVIPGQEHFKDILSRARAHIDNVSHDLTFSLRTLHLTS